MTNSDKRAILLVRFDSGNFRVAVKDVVQLPKPSQGTGEGPGNV